MSGRQLKCRTLTSAWLETPMACRTRPPSLVALSRVRGLKHVPICLLYTSGWAQAPYGTKAQVDANYKRMLHYGCMPDNARYVPFGVASHNLFDLCYAMRLREREGVRDQVEFEMLEEMCIRDRCRACRLSSTGRQQPWPPPWQSLCASTPEAIRSRGHGCRPCLRGYCLLYTSRCV